MKISEIKDLREHFDYTHIVIFGIDKEGKQHVATHGLTEGNAKEAAKAGNNLKKHLGFPEHLCNTDPLERKCENCTYYKPDWGIHCANGWSGDGTRGHCLYTRPKITTNANEKCGEFEPKY